MRWPACFFLPCRLLFRTADGGGRDTYNQGKKMITGKIEVVNSSDIGWSEMLMEEIGRPFYVKPVLDEPETGMGVTLLWYTYTRRS